MSHVGHTPTRAELLVQSVSDHAIYMLDPNGVVSSWNVGAERLKLYSANEIIGQHFSRFYTAEDQAAGLPAQVLERALLEGRFEAEGWRVRKDGQMFWANVVIDPIRDEGGRHIGFAKVTRDLTERREAEEALRRSEERFRLLVEGVTDYAIYMLDPQGLVSSWNAGAHRFKGYEAEEIIGHHFSRFYPEEDKAAGLPERALATAERDGRFEAEGWRMRKDGSRFWASVIIDPIRDPSGTLLGFTKITRDLTERKLAREQLEFAREQLFQSQKLESIGQLTGGVAHDFNNILAAIMGSVGLAQRRLQAGADITRFLDNAMLAAQRGALLTQRMLTFARKQDLQLEAVDVIATVQDMADMLERTLGPAITIDTRYPLALRPVMADKGQLELALMNLLVNARDAMPRGGTIVIAAFSERDTSGAEFVHLSVSDTGEGMDAETLARAIEPFYTTKGIGKGTGLGLSMVQGMAEQVGGKLLLTSIRGQGTRAEIVLPAAESLTITTPKEQSCIATVRKLTVLAVDDDPIVLLNTAASLEDLGHDVLQASSGQAALGILQERHVDLIVTDYAMPGMNGAELIEHAQATRPDLKVIVASGYADLSDGTELRFPRLSKPFTPGELAASVARVAG